MDPDILTLVSGMSLPDLTIDNTLVRGYAQREVAEESYPVLIEVAGASCEGLLINGLTDTAMQRIHFYEGEEYQLSDIDVELMTAASQTNVDSPLNGAAIRQACYYREAGAYTTLAQSWSFSRWVAEEKTAFLPRVADYMSLFGTMTMAEADAFWIKSGIDAGIENGSDGAPDEHQMRTQHLTGTC